MTLDLTGQQFGRLTVKNISETRKRNYVYWICECECGVIKEYRSSHLKKGAINSCGCNSCIRPKTHGLTRTKGSLYKIWLGIKTRCYNKNSYAYKDYGGRGIKMSDEWKNDFIKFNIDMIKDYKPGLTIERKDVNGNYEKENCVWITRSKQANNRRCSIWIDTLEGRMTIQQARKIAGISWPAMYVRVKQKWPIEKLLIPRSFRQK